MKVYGGAGLSGMTFSSFFDSSALDSDAGNGNIQNRLDTILYLRVLQPENHSDRDLGQPIVKYTLQTVGAQVRKR